MTATYEDISRWLIEAHEQGAAFLIIGHDWFDHENFPIFCKDGEECHEKLKGLQGSGNRYDEVYDMSLPIETQRNELRSMHIPPK